MSNTTQRLNIETVTAIYFSPTGTTKKTVQTIAHSLADGLSCPMNEFDFTLPAARTGFPALNGQTLAVFGCPTYAGRLPNLLLPYLRTIVGSDALAVAVVTFGNRAFDNALCELRDMLDCHGFQTIAAGAFSCEHSFSRDLGAGRPDMQDQREMAQFANAICHKLAAPISPDAPVRLPLPGLPAEENYGGYYQPRDRHGVSIDIRKVKPKTAKTCIRCGLCAAVCPMGAIDPADVTQIPGICIKCGACSKKCPVSAKFYDDPGYLYHKTELEAMYGGRRAENSLFL